MSFWEPNHFGYLGKIVLNDSLEFLLTYNTYSNIDTTFLQIIVNNIKSSVSFPFLKENLHRGNWFQFDFIFDVQQNKLSVITDSITQIIVDIPYAQSNKLDLIFGARYSFIDQPTYSIRELKISIDKEQESRKNYYWSFENIENNKSYDIINDKEVELKNCQLLSELHYKWRKLGEINTKGSSDFSIDDKDGKVIVVDETSVNVYDLQSNQTNRFVAQASAKDFKIYYDSLTQNLYSYHRGGGEVSTFDWFEKEWSGIDTSQDLRYFYHNSTFINQFDSSLYMFGGYGWYTFNNKFQTYDFSSKRWDTVSVSGDIIEPRIQHSRFLSITDSTMITYGGYGNITGKQEEGVKYFHDLWELNLKSLKIKKLETFNKNGEESENRLFYYDKITDKYYFFGTKYYFIDPISKEGGDKYLNILKFTSDSSSNFTLINTSKINKELNVLDAFYNRKTNEIIAIFWSSIDDGHIYEIHSIFLPMIKKEIAIADNDILILLDKYWPRLLVLIIIITGIVLVVRMKTEKGKKEDKAIIFENEDDFEIVNYSIYLFGDLQFLDKTLKDKTHLMSAKLTELFMLILFHTFKLTSNNGANGITTEKLSSILWPEMSNSSLKNIRNVTIYKLRGVLSELGDIKIVFHNGLWKIEIDESQIDYVVVLDIINNCEFNQLSNLLNIAKRGRILNNISYDWLDPIKVATDNIIIDCLIEHLCKIHDEKSLFKVAETILSIDSVNEIGLKAKLQVLNSQGKHSAVKNVYDNFIMEYTNLYDEKYEKSLKDILS